MCPLNSLIITGTVQAVEDCKDSNKILAEVKYRRDSRDLNGHVVVEEFDYHVEIDGRQADLFRTKAAKGTEIRAVGKLKRSGLGVLLVYAEHVEYAGPLKNVS